MDMNNLFQSMAKAIQMNSNNIDGSPMAENAKNILMNKDSQSGEKLANNFIESMGMTKEEAVQSAMAYLQSLQR